jgi:hypothetical protein
LFLSVADNIATRLNTATNLDNNLYDNDFWVARDTVSRYSDLL